MSTCICINKCILIAKHALAAAAAIIIAAAEVIAAYIFAIGILVANIIAAVVKVILKLLHFTT